MKILTFLKATWLFFKNLTLTDLKLSLFNYVKISFIYFGSCYYAHTNFESLELSDETNFL